MLQASNNLKLFDMPTADCAQHMFWRGRGDAPGEQPKTPSVGVALPLATCGALALEAEMVQASASSHPCANPAVCPVNQAIWPCLAPGSRCHAQLPIAPFNGLASLAAAMCLAAGLLRHA